MTGGRDGAHHSASVEQSTVASKPSIRDYSSVVHFDCVITPEYVCCSFSRRLPVFVQSRHVAWLMQSPARSYTR